MYQALTEITMSMYALIIDKSINDAESDVMSLS